MTTPDLDAPEATSKAHAQGATTTTNASSSSSSSFHAKKHMHFIAMLDRQRDSLLYWHTQHLRLNGLYWGLVALYLLPETETIRLPCDAAATNTIQDATNTIQEATNNSQEATNNSQEATNNSQEATNSQEADNATNAVRATTRRVGPREILVKDDVVAFILSCYDAQEGGFGGCPGHDAHLLYTLSAVQVLVIYDALASLGTARHDAIIQYVLARQLPDGSFTGDVWGEVDTRFSYCAVATLSLLGALDRLRARVYPVATDGSVRPTPGGTAQGHVMDGVAATIRFIEACRNFDGGYGSVPGAESHAGQIFCCVGALCILDALHTPANAATNDLLAAWLCERQLPCGGLNGRPEKLEDVCYSWWVVSCLAMLKRLHWISNKALMTFILSCQDAESGGIADRPGDMADVFHTLFGIAGLCMMGYEGLGTVDPVYCLPYETTARLGLLHANVAYGPKK